MITAAQYQAAQALITARVLALMLRAMNVLGVPLTDNQRRTFAQAVFRDIDLARQQSYALAVRNMRYSAGKAEVALPDVAALPTYTPDAVVQVLERATQPIETARADLDQVSRRQSRATVNYREPSDPLTVNQIGRNAGASLARHAHQAGRVVVQDTAEAADEQVGWARVLTGAENCPFCAMLASRGPVYRSEHVAVASNIAGDAYHDHCDCRAELVFKGKPWSGEAEFERLEALWRDSTHRKHGKAAIKAFASAYTA